MKFSSLVIALFTGLLWGDAGVLVPTDAKQPDPKILTLDEMTIRVVIDNGHAKVNVIQIFANHTSGPIEGNYVFALPGRALISDFAVWDDTTRIPGVILERKRAEELYNDIRAQAIDPGLLQMGERDADEARRSSIFSARIAPIPAYGTKRLEMEYQERLQVEQGDAYFSIPLRPDVYHAQTAGKLSITLDLKSAHAMRDAQFLAKIYPMQITGRTDKGLHATFQGQAVSFTEDFALKYSLDARRDSLEVLTYRDGTDPGFFEASALLNLPQTAAQTRPRSIVVLFDASLSMQWEKLERSYAALEALLRSLKPGDQFNVLLYNDKISSFQPAPVAGSMDNVEKALAFLKSERLRGGTDMQAALNAGLSQTYANDPYLVLLSDLGSTRGILQKTANWPHGTARNGSRLPRPNDRKPMSSPVGDDANIPLGKMLAQNNGVLEQVRSTEPVDFKLKAFISKIGRRPVDNLQLGINPAAGFTLVYPLEDKVFPGGVQTWVGQYQRPGGPRATFSVLQARTTVAFAGRKTPTIRSSLANGPRPESTRCSIKSNAKVKTRPPSTRLSVSRGNTNS